MQGLPNPPVAIAVDTLARCMAGGDENSAKDMSLFVQSCDRLRAETRAAVLVVHHSGKADKSAERGSSALRGAADTMIELALETEGGLKVKCSKQKEDAPFEDLVLRRCTVMVEALGDGKFVNSCYLTPFDVQTRGAPVHADLDEGGLQICRVLRDVFFEDGASGDQLKTAAKLGRSHFYEQLKQVVEKGYVERSKVRGSYRYKLTPKFTEPPVHRVRASPEKSTDSSAGESTSPPVPGPFMGPDGGTGPVACSKGDACVGSASPGERQVDVAVRGKLASDGMGQEEAP